MLSPTSLAGDPGTSEHRAMLLLNARLGVGGRLASVLITDGVVTSIAEPTAHRRCTSTAEVIDLAGRTVLPGFWDAHVHTLQWACARRRISLREAGSARHAAAIMGDAARDGRYRAGEVLVGYGFQDGLWSDVPHASLLDAACPANPVILVSNDLHACWLNRRAMEVAGISGHPDGLLLETEGDGALARLESVAAKTADEWVLDAVRSAATRGVVGITDFEVADNVADWRRRARGRTLPVKVECTIYPQDLDHAIDAGLRTGQRIDVDGNHLEVGHLKIFVDGSLNARTAYCNVPYPGLNGEAACGLVRTPVERLYELVRQAVPRGIYPAVHAIGDRAVSIALDAFEKLECPGRIEHAQLVDQPDFKRVDLPGLILGVQPSHLLDDRGVAERHWHGRTAGAFAYGALLRAGATLEIGSDAPVGPMDPWVGIAAAINRATANSDSWHPENALTLEQALTAASRGRQHVEVGMQADLVVTDTDPVEIAPHDLPNIPVSGTLSSGRWTHRTFD